MIFELCPTLSRDLIKREFLNTAAAFGVLVLLGFAAGMIFPDMAQQTLQNFAAQVEQLGLTDDVPQSQMMATLFFNNITASLLSMLYGLIPFLPLSALALGTKCADARRVRRHLSAAGHRSRCVCSRRFAPRHF